MENKFLYGMIEKPHWCVFTDGIAPTNKKVLELFGEDSYEPQMVSVIEAATMIGLLVMSEPEIVDMSYVSHWLRKKIDKYARAEIWRMHDETRAPELVALLDHA